MAYLWEFINSKKEKKSYQQKLTSGWDFFAIQIPIPKSPGITVFKNKRKFE